MAHAIGSATISFGLVSIPVKLHTTSQSSDTISFNLLHGSCNSRLKQQYICSSDGELVERSAMVKGYEVAKNQYVIFTEEELKAIEQKASESIDIVHFVPSSTIDPLYFDKAYYLSPAKGGERAYALLGAAIRESGKWAIARYAARGKQYVVALRTFEDALVLQQLHYASAIKPLAELEIGTREIKQQELMMALQLTEFGSEEAFDPHEFRDESKERMRELIEQKMQGQQIKV
jgi:DNA end-binding protein Ku